MDVSFLHYCKFRKFRFHLKHYTLYLKPLKPINTYRNLQFRNPDNTSPTVGSNIRINWGQHPHDSVDYHVWRKVKHNGVWGSPTLIASLNHNANYYIDYDYVYTDGYTDDMLDYDVRAHLHYFGNHSYSDIDYETTFGKTEATIIQETSISMNATEIPGNYSIANYPNPFNPTTTISYQLPEKSFVTIQVFDILGKEAATLVNENKSAGYYSVNFDGSKLSSGIYIYTLSANGIVQTNKMLLTK